MKGYKRKDKFDKEKSPRRDGGRDSAKPSMFKTTCNNCGKDCEVPFKPTGSKPVYCSNCFVKDNSEGPRRSGSGTGDRKFPGIGHREHGFADRHAERPEMFVAVCDKCGDDCEVPFRPRKGKPVYCDNCFEKSEHRKDSGVEQFKKELEAIHVKLDKILTALTQAAVKIDVVQAQVVAEDPTPVKKTKKVAATETAVKKPAAVKKKG